MVDRKLLGLSATLHLGRNLGFEITNDPWKGVHPMKLSYLMVANAVVNMIFGIAFVLVPGLVLGVYGVMAMERPVEQLLGVELIGFAVLNWFARNATGGETLRAILLANFVANALGFIVTLLLSLSGVPNALVWSAVVIPLLFALGFGYFLFIKRSASATAQN